MPFQLSPVQLQFVDLLRKRNERWKRGRWFLMFGGILLAVSGILLPRLAAPNLAELYDLFPDDPDLRIAMSLDLLKIYIRISAASSAFFVLGILCEAMAALHWKGAPEVSLLLSLIDDESQEGVEP